VCSARLSRLRSRCRLAVARVAHASGLGVVVLPSHQAGTGSTGVCWWRLARRPARGELPPVPAWAVAGGPGVAVSAWRSLGAILSGMAGVSEGGGLPSHGPRAGVCAVPKGAQGAVGGAGRSPGRRGPALRGHHGCTARIPWWCGGAVPRAACACPPVLGVGLRVPAGARATEPAEAGQVGSRGHSGAEQGRVVTR
jgi:hypothetical protein